MAGKKRGKKKASKKKASKKAARRPKKASKKAARRPKKAARRHKKKAKGARRRRRRSTRLLRAMRSRRRGRMKRTASAALRRIRKLRPAERRTAQAMGLMKKQRRNPDGVLGFLKSEASDMMAMAPSIAVQLGAMAGVGWASKKAETQVQKMVVGSKTGEEATKAQASFFYKYAGAMSSGAISIAAFAAMKMMKQDGIRRFALPVLMGGMAATIVNVLAAVKVKPAPVEGVDPKTQTDISLGKRLGLPIGEYTAISGFLNVHGRRVAIDGLGDYVDQPLGALDISRDRFGEGAVLSMGDYVDQPLGAINIHSTIEGSTLGEIGQMSEGRQGARALNSPGDMRVESFINSGSLAGSVFD